MRVRVVITSFFAIVLCVGMAHACTLLWDAPTTNEDGSPLTDLANYRAYYRVNTGGTWQLLGEVGATVTSVVVEPCLVGQYMVHAVNAVGVASDDSNIASVKKPGKVPNTRVVR